MIITDSVFLAVPKSVRKAVADYIRRDGFSRGDGFWRSSPTFVFNGNVHEYLNHAIDHCNDEWQGVVDDYDECNNDYAEYLKRKY